MVKCDVLWQFRAFLIVTAVILLYVKQISQNGTFYDSQIDSSVTFEPVGRFA